jgi:hypothetical protein
MGNMIGGTLAHEIGHSLGLANPYMDDAGNAPNRLMDAGGDRRSSSACASRAKARGVDEYTYLR